MLTPKEKEWILKGINEEKKEDFIPFHRYPKNETFRLYNKYEYDPTVEELVKKQAQYWKIYFERGAEAVKAQIELDRAEVRREARELTERWTAAAAK